jgi:deazaflavin-dependent oxidoreductase (nitroreductase family)
MKLPHFFWHLVQIGPLIAYAVGLGPLIGRSILLLTTQGRKSGLPRVTPLVYEELDGSLVVASARGNSADWLRNIMVNPRVSVRAGRRHFGAVADVTRDPERIADYLQRQLMRNPAMFGAILRSEGLPSNPGRADLVRLTPRRPMVTIRAATDP